MAAPIVTKPIPAQIINELAALGPLDLKPYFSYDPNEQPTFSAILGSGSGLPQGLICTADSILTGIAAKDTAGSHEVIVTLMTPSGSIQTEFNITIQPSAAATADTAGYIDQLKAQVWQALDNKLPAPDLSDLYNQKISIMDVYYLMERWASLVIWNSDDLSVPSNPVVIDVADINKHYQIVDRGSCVVARPKDLFSHERTTADALQAARILAREVYKRDWKIEFAGFEKMVRAAWVEFQHLEDKHGKRIEIFRYDPGFKEIRIYTEEQKEMLYRDAMNRND